MDTGTRLSRERRRKFVAAGRRNQHARRVRYPEGSRLRRPASKLLPKMKQSPLRYAAGFYALGLITGWLIGSGALRPPTPVRLSGSQAVSPTPAPVRPAIPSVFPTPTPTPAPRSSVAVFKGGLVCEGAEGVVPLARWRVCLGGSALALRAGVPPSVELPPDPDFPRPVALSITVAGWKSADVSLPAADPQGRRILKRITLIRETAPLRLKCAATGVDYDTLEADWLHPLAGQPCARPLHDRETFPLDSPLPESREPLVLPTGCYRLVLKSKRAPERIRDFVLAPEVQLQAGGSIRNSTLPLPPSLAGRLIGIAGTIPAAEPNDPPVGAFCGLDINLKENRGSMLVAFHPLKEQSIGYAEMQPRPDNCWPISNLFLENPGRLEFDCPLNHADYRVILENVDGRITVQTHLVLPENEQQRADLLARMLELIRVQSLQSGSSVMAVPAGFDPNFSNARMEDLPNYKNLASPSEFRRHLDRLALSASKPIALATRIAVHHPANRPWEFGAEPARGNRTKLPVTPKPQ